ncbi:hypothetical protein [Rhizobium leguminosarum]|uniref:hypothetical protein n=1 Tax=Rhizobium leguminosarum TaxID=384 RepID=UPI001614E54F|nr:hypothetical protein [Rhizobium leguminosarum]MBB4465469.1 hypothetical protein [Rhizobium leguminosarum]MBB4472131.1 hypothetical protein [Rhizobium leguminosarum]MBY5416926.1 hypothetical protein [Rhizobium leguminosarum]
MGYREDERDKALEQVPLFVADPVQWPDGVRTVGIDELNNLGIDREGVLHWNGRVITIEKRLRLTFWQTAVTAIVTATAALVALSTIVQGLAAYSTWACPMGLPAICL